MFSRKKRYLSLATILFFEFAFFYPFIILKQAQVFWVLFFVIAFMDIPFIYRCVVYFGCRLIEMSLKGNICII